MPTTIDPLAARRALGRREWGPPRAYGAGWCFVRDDPHASVLLTSWVRDDGVEWVHASIARRDQLPTYDDLKTLHKAAWPKGGYAYQVFAPPDHHVNIHANCLHLWGRADGEPALPNFRENGMI